MPEEIYKITFKLEPDDGPFDGSGSPGPGGGGISPGGAVAGGLGANLGVNLVKAIIGRGRGFGGSRPSGAGVPAPRPPKLPPPLTQTLNSNGRQQSKSWLPGPEPSKNYKEHTPAHDDYLEWERRTKSYNELNRQRENNIPKDNRPTIFNSDVKPPTINNPKEYVRDLEKIKG